MVRTQISLTEEQYIAVKQIAAEREISFSAVIRETVDNLVALSRRSAWEGLRSIAGTASSGIGDIAERHDDYLYGEIVGE
jgi:hypothetical protein